MIRALQYFDDLGLTKRSKQALSNEKSKKLDAQLKLRRGLASTFSPESFPSVHKANITTICSIGTDHILSGAADGSLGIIDINLSKNLRNPRKMFKSGILSLSQSPSNSNSVIATCMDGNFHLIGSSSETWSSDVQGLHLEKSFADHGRSYVYGAKWAPSGQMFATYSADHTIKVYRCMNRPDWEICHTMRLEGTPECIEWVNVRYLRYTYMKDCIVYAMRGDNYLRFVDTCTFTECDKINLNTIDDDHISFTPLDLTFSQDVDVFAVATDNSRCLLLSKGTNGPIRSYYGVINDEYSRPKLTFDSTGCQLFCSSQDNTIVSWDVGSQNVVQRMEGHFASVVCVLFVIYRLEGYHLEPHS